MRYQKLIFLMSNTYTASANTCLCPFTMSSGKLEWNFSSHDKIYWSVEWRSAFTVSLYIWTGLLCSSSVLLPGHVISLWYVFIDFYIFLSLILSGTYLNRFAILWFLLYEYTIQVLYDLYFILISHIQLSCFFLSLSISLYLSL